MKGFFKILLKNPVFVNMLMFIVIAGGIFGAASMSRELFPSFELDRILVEVVCRGAYPAEVEESICLKLEEAIDGIEGVKEIQTTAAEGCGSALITVEDGFDLNDVVDEVTSAVDAISTFPADAESPTVEKIKRRANVLSIIVWGDLPERQLKEAVRVLKDELLQIKGISQASISGTREYEISVEVSEDKLRKYNLNFSMVSDAIRRNGLNYSMGTIRTSDEEYRIRAVGRKYHARDYDKIPIITRTDGTIITLGDIAEIKDTFNPDSRVISLFNGKPAVSLNVFKTDKEDTIDISDNIKKFLLRKEKEMPESIHFTITADMAKLIRGRLNMLVNNGMLGLVLVFFALWMFLDIRLSFWVTLGIPISLAGAMVIMALSGCSINMLSLFGFIMVLGLIVDDAIVIGESIYNKRVEGAGCRDSVINGTSIVALPVIAAVTTTIVAFTPLFAITGIMGKFILQIPIPVIAALSVSLIECLIILPVHLRHLPGLDKTHSPKKYNIMGRLRQKISRGLTHFIKNIYGPFVKLAIQWRYLAVCIAVGVLIIIGGLIKSGWVKISFFPKTDSDYIMAKIEMTPGTTLAETKKVAARVLAGWRKVEKMFADDIPADKKMSSGVYTLIGASTMFGEGVTKSSELEINIDLLGSEYRKIFSDTLVGAWQKAVGPIAGALRTSFTKKQHDVGGNPIEVKIKGDSYDDILAAANALKEKIALYPGVYDEKIDYNPGKREFVITIKPSAYRYGLSLDDISRYIRGGFYGNEALRFQSGRDDIRVKVRYPEKGGRNSIEYLKTLRIEIPGGKRVPLASVADIKLQEGLNTTTRYNRKRVIQVVADLSKDGNLTEIMADLRTNVFKEIETRYPVICEIEGQEKERMEAMGGLFFGFPLALLGIYFIIASMFRSYMQPVVIMTIIPFGLIGGVIGHILMGKSLSILSMFGLVALSGIVVNDAIVLIEAVNTQMEAGVALHIAVCEGGKRRFRAILLTTLTTCAGLMPLILEKSFQAQFLIPMAISIAFGVMFATVLTLVLMPCQLMILSDFRRLWHRLWSQEWRTREELEPRSNTYIHENFED